MSTPAQQAANRNNSRLSTGPATAQGKSASSQNSRKHGLTAKQVVIGGEKLDDFESLKSDLTEQYAPTTTTEQIYVNEIAENYWRLMRARRIETELLDSEMEALTGNRIVSLSNAFLNVSAELDKVRRYMVSIERAWHRAIAQLTKVQSDRKALAFLDAETRRDDEEAARAELTAERDQAIHDYLMAPVPDSPDSIGFVSQTAIPAFEMAGRTANTRTANT